MRAVKSVWDERVIVVLHRVPEDEEFEGGFEATTLTGVPHGVVVIGSNPESAGEALANLLDGLREFGFVGKAIVEDATEPGPVKQYEVRV